MTGSTSLCSPLTESPEWELFSVIATRTAVGKKFCIFV